MTSSLTGCTVDKRLRILYVHFNSELTGSDVSLLNLVRALDQERFIPYVVLPFDGPLVPQFEAAGAKVSFIPQPKLRRKVKNLLQYPILFGPTVMRIRKYILENRIDIVHTNALLNMYGPLAAKLAGRPHIHHLRQGKSGVIHSLVARTTLHFSSFVIPVAEEEKRRLYGSTTDNRIRVVHNGINCNQIQYDAVGRARVRQEFNIPEDALVVGCISNVGFAKGQDVLVEAMTNLWPRFPNLYCLLVGASPPNLRQHLYNIAETIGAGERLLMAGAREQKDIASYISAFDIAVHPSLAEAFSRAVLEAMACGRPFIASRVGGNPEAVQHGESGLLVEGGNPDELADALEQLIVDPRYAYQLGRAARRRIEALFSITRHAYAIEELYFNTRGGRDK